MSELFTNRYWQQFTIIVKAFEKFTTEKLYTHYGKYQPKD